MIFQIIKDLLDGRYYVSVIVKKLTEEDSKKANKFGWPKLEIILNDGTIGEIEISKINSLAPYGFYKKEDADNYVKNIKEKIRELKNNWAKLYDNWSSVEEI